ncbi:MAG: cyclic nucleotide-binding domain-containing protein [Bdellovibrionales bacterium]
MDNQKKLKKGEILFRENEPIGMLYVVQSGKIALNVERGGKKVEVMTAGVSQLLGEQALFANARHMFTAEALQETKLMEVPVEVVKTQLAAAQSAVKVLVKSMVDEAKVNRQALRSVKMEGDKSPCPQPAIPRIFAMLNLVGRHTGKKNPEKPEQIRVDWGVLKLNATRMFAESPQRMRSLLELLAKIGLCELQMGKNEEGEEELQGALIHNIQQIEDFAEFYQYNLYKGSYSETIHVDTLAMRVAKGLVLLSEGLEPDRRGAVTLVWDQVLEDMKKRLGIELKGTHLDALEKKGLFVKRQSREKEPAVLMFDRTEFQKMAMFWQIIHEIDKWNDKGFVDMHEKEAPVKAPAAGEMACPQCSGVVNNTHKFCPHCGNKLNAAA